MAKAKSFRRLCNACVRLDANAAMPVSAGPRGRRLRRYEWVRSQTAERAHRRDAILLANPPQARSADQRSADVIVKEIDTSSRPPADRCPKTDFVATHNKVASLVNELRTA